jgi:FixJ family two-component response regulator
VPVKRFIAFVDDDESVGEAIKEYLGASGFDVEAYFSAEDFLRCGRIDETACLITDVTMPGLSGFDLSERLKMLGYEIPVIIVTGYVHEGTRAKAINAGAVCFLPKPVAMKELLSCIQSALDLHKPGTQ